MDPTAGFSESAIRLQLQQIRRVDVAGIAIRILVQLGRFAGTLLAANMLAALALLGSTGKRLSTRVAGSPDSLPHGLADEILPA